MTLPVIISVPHAGLRIPDEVASNCQLTPEQIVKDGDEFAGEIYDFQHEVAEFVSADIARAFVDLNRAATDRRPDGVVKLHTIWNEPIYRKPLNEDTIRTLLEKYYDPYHQRLKELTERGLLFAIDCHTMAAESPPIDPNPGTRRPEVCLGNVHGKSFPAAWTKVIHHEFQTAFAGFRVTLNQPFAGGFITKTHSGKTPWLQVELSRSEFLPIAEMRERVLQAIQATCEILG